MTDSSEAFEKWAAKKYPHDSKQEYYAREGWQARDAEIQALKEEVERLEAALQEYAIRSAGPLEQRIIDAIDNADGETIRIKLYSGKEQADE